MKSTYDLEKIKFGTDNGSWMKAAGLYDLTPRSHVELMTIICYYFLTIVGK
jgi:hypothetical protein